MSNAVVAAQYIAARINSAVNPTERDDLTVIKQLYERKLWHQLTEVSGHITLSIFHPQVLCS